DDVQEHADREEVAYLLRREARHSLDVLDEPAEAAAADVSHLWIVAGGVRLHLPLEPPWIAENGLVISLGDRFQRVLARFAGGRLSEHLERLVEALLDGREVQLLLGSEEPEEVRL